MPKRCNLKKKTLNKVQMIKDTSRERIGIVPSTKIIQDKRKRVKHKKKEEHE
jgi:hypothetical protein